MIFSTFLMAASMVSGKVSFWHAESIVVASMIQINRFIYKMCLKIFHEYSAVPEVTVKFIRYKIEINVVLQDDYPFTRKR